MSDYLETHYSRTRNAGDPFPRLEGQAETDTCVIGGGLAGINTALGLAERGQKVLLLEAQRVGWGASGRNGGFVSPGFALSTDALCRQVGLEQGKALFRLTQDAMALVKGRIDRLEIDCDPVTGIVGASWFDRPDEVKKSVDFYRETFGEAVEFWPRERVREAFRSERYYDAVFKSDCFHMQPLNFALGLAREAAGKGAGIFEDSPVTGLSLDGAQKQVETAAGRVTAKNVVFCCSGYVGGLYGPVSRATLPVGTYVMVTEPLGARLQEAVTVPYGLSDSRMAGDYYRPLSDGRLLWGGRMRALKAPADLKSVMLGDMLKIYPQLKGARAELAWEGTMGYATHKMPQIGRTAEGVWHCMGFGGHGLCSTTMGGELIATAIAEGDDRYRLFEPFGLTYTGGPLGPYVAQVVYWTYELGDLLRR